MFVLLFIELMLKLFYLFTSLLICYIYDVHALGAGAGHDHPDEHAPGAGIKPFHKLTEKAKKTGL